MLDKKDFKNIFLLIVVTFSLNILGLSQLEFFRHTEADRTLIAWEMWESSEYLIPKLIHSVILTKPPLYYWTQALSFQFFGRVDEFTARFPSVVISALFVILQYLTWRKSKANHYQSFFASIALITGMFFFLQSTVAEIDILFGFLSTLTFYFSFFAIERQSLTYTLLTYLAAGLAFLTKGIPIVFLLIAIHGVFFLFYTLKNHFLFDFKYIFKFTIYNVLGICVFLSIVFPWINYIAQNFGWDELIRQYHVEVAQRFIEEKNHPRGPLYYIGILAGLLAPWTLIYVAFFIQQLLKKRFPNFINQNYSRSAFNLNFILFNLIAVLLGLFLLSIAKGKSARYIFPVYASCINLLPYMIERLKETVVEKWLFIAGKFLSLIISLLICLSIFFIELPYVEKTNIVICGILLIISLSIFLFSCRDENRKQLLFGTIVLFFGIRFGLNYIFYPIRNSEKSVKYIAKEIDSALPQGAIVYNIEFFERWVNYYLKHLGRETYRLNPVESLNPSNINGRSFILLQEEEEGWRLEILKKLDRSLKVLRIFQSNKVHFLLVEADSNFLKYLKTQSYFPTVPSEPFSLENTNGKVKNL